MVELGDVNDGHGVGSVCVCVMWAICNDFSHGRESPLFVLGVRLWEKCVVKHCYAVVVESVVDSVVVSSALPSSFLAFALRVSRCLMRALASSMI